MEIFSLWYLVNLMLRLISAVTAPLNPPFLSRESIVLSWSQPKNTRILNILYEAIMASFICKCENRQHYEIPGIVSALSIKKEVTRKY